jgi:light-regulated signal transduction histidine kinase (bacteriophytochrome)
MVAGHIAHAATVPPGGSDLSTCDREPIHIPGFIQPQGALITITPDNFRVIQASANLADILGLSAEYALGRSLHEVLGNAARLAIEAFVSCKVYVPHNILTIAGPAGQGLTLRTHTSGSVICIEIEPMIRPVAGVTSSITMAQAVIETFYLATTQDDLCAGAARELKALTGYDRVMVYCFDQQGHGEVVAEAREPDLTAYLGLHYPATDIPRQARDIFLRQRVRLIADINYTPVPIIPHATLHDGAPLDMTHLALRGVSPVHVEYLTNMGVRASLAIAIRNSNGLWGLIVGHHGSPRWMDTEKRAAVDIIGQVMSSLLHRFGVADADTRQLKMNEVMRSVAQFFAAAGSVTEAVTTSAAALLQLVNAGGALVHLAGRFQTIGQIPKLADARRAFSALQSAAEGKLLSVDDLELRYPACTDCSSAGSGALFLPLSSTTDDAILWFRPEQVRTVLWGGDPNKPMHPDPIAGRLSPRKSFDAWKELVRGRSAPWREVDFRLALELRRVIETATNEHARLDLEVRFRFAAQAGRLGIWELDLVSDELMMSDRGKEIFGRDPHAPFSYADLRAAIHLDDRDRWDAELERCRNGAADFDIEFRVVRLKDVTRWVQVQAQLERAKNGNPIKMSGISLDITERILTQDRIRQSQRIEAVGRLTAGVAHDFNNVLQVLLGGLELARDAAADRPDVYNQLGIALKAGQRGARLTSHLLSFARQQVLRPTAVDLPPLVTELSRTLARVMGLDGLDIKIRVAVAPDLPPVLVDAAYLDSALLNLALNARDAMPAGGELWFKIEPVSGQVVITVEDTGQGMPPDVLAQACEPFFSTKGVNGSGLGLSMVQGFARQSGGDLRIRSAVDKGTSIELTLPVAPPPGGGTVSAVNRRLRGSGKVLFVDDDPTVSMIITAFLGQAGFDVVSAGDGKAALSILASEPGFDALVTDYVMPEMNGADLIAWARELYPALPAMVITGYAGAKDLAGLPADVVVLRKPCQRDDLVNQVKGLIDRAAARAAQ